MRVCMLTWLWEQTSVFASRLLLTAVSRAPVHGVGESATDLKTGKKKLGWRKADKVRSFTTQQRTTAKQTFFFSITCLEISFVPFATTIEKTVFLFCFSTTAQPFQNQQLPVASIREDSDTSFPKKKKISQGSCQQGWARAEKMPSGIPGPCLCLHALTKKKIANIYGC